MSFRSIELPEVGKVTIYKRRGARSLRLSITATGEVRVSQPMWLPYKAGTEFALARRDWIRQNRPSHSGQFYDGQKIGKAHHITFVPSNVDRPKAYRKASLVTVKYPVAQSTSHPGAQAAARTAALKSLKIEADRLLPQRLAGLASARGFSYASVNTRQLKSRWGSCTDKRHITLNIFLMELPWHLIDYVLLHELTHTKVLNHGPEFWQELACHVASPKSLRKEIRNYRPDFTFE